MEKENKKRKATKRANDTNVITTVSIQDDSSRLVYSRASSIVCSITGHPIYVNFSGFRSLTELPLDNIIEFNCETAITSTILSVRDQVPGFDPKNFLILTNLLPTTHNVYNNNLGVIFISHDNHLRHFSQLLLLNSRNMIIPRHVFDLLYFTKNSCYIMCVLNQFAFSLNVEYIKNQVTDFHKGVISCDDYVIISLPFVVSNITPLSFSEGTPKYMKSKHCVQAPNTGDIILKTMHTPIASMLSVPGKSKVIVDGQEKQYKYTNTHFPQTAIGTSCGLVFTEDDKPWGITVSSNGSISGSMFKYFSN